MLVDRFANEGVTSRDRGSSYAWDLLPLGKLREDYLCQATQDMEQWNNRLDQTDPEEQQEVGERHTN